MTESPPGYLTAETLAEYFRSAAATVQPVVGGLPYRLRIDPVSEELALQVPADGPLPDVTALTRLDVDTVDIDGADWHQLHVDAQGMHYEAYSMLAAVAEDLRQGSSFVLAVANALRSYGDLLERRHGLTPEQQQGLIGELLLIRHVRSALGPAQAVDSWLGPAVEQHDFAFEVFDVEVKTTTAEARSHMIGSLTQLDPNLNRPLWLVSIQLTRAGAGGSGWSLSDLVGELRTILDPASNQFLDRLRDIGWRDADHDLYRTRYLFRSAPAAYPIDDDFPALTRQGVDAVVPRPELVGDVSYRIDITTLKAVMPPEPLRSFVGKEPG